jgi:hypothetical protein
MGGHFAEPPVYKNDKDESRDKKQRNHPP